MAPPSAGLAGDINSHLLRTVMSKARSNSIISINSNIDSNDAKKSNINAAQGSRMELNTLASQGT